MADEENFPPTQRAATYTLPLRPRMDGSDTREFSLGPMAGTTPDAHQHHDPAAVPRGLASPDISVELAGDHSHHDSPFDKPALLHPRSAPPHVQHFQSPMRHHKRTPSVHREIKETLNAHSEYTSDDSDGRSHFHVNQYVIKEEIGRGSYGAVHLATDQFGKEYAVKAFSKTRLRKRIQSNILRHGPRSLGRFPSRAPFGAPDLPIARLSDQRAKEEQDPLFLIREEIAVMKKLNHPNLVQLIEVLDDPEEDTLYMVLEMCKKGVIMKVGLGEEAKPIDEEQCRHWFRDLILGVEYLHSQGVVHRDIKPDNLLLNEDDVLKIVDFGVSEMFEQSADMKTAKSAGSPAFLPPELCVAKHGDVSGKAADIWSMGVSLYCLRYGKIPFEKVGVLEMYEAIRTETPFIPEGEDALFVDLMNRLMEKDPAKRISMEELREHPWVTKSNLDPLLLAEENCSDPVDPPNPLEVNHAFTRRMSHLICVMKAIRKFKSLLSPHPRPPNSPYHHSPRPSDTADFAASILRERQQFLQSPPPHLIPPSTPPQPLLLGIGTGGLDTFSSTQDDAGLDGHPLGIVADSPTTADFSIYDRAFDAEVERIKRSGSLNRKGGQPGEPKIYHTRFNDPEEKGGLWGDLVNKGAQGGRETTSKFAELVEVAVARERAAAAAAVNAEKEREDDGEVKEKKSEWARGRE
ncbi:putative calcium/calmodulin-dependent protein kinase [Triangularia verruculosa]|uniref:Calcium/calmodulin-dependent protein kinase n=1 Tax=Triangularia verruculosa TaxID=2587418 RepID=A0AAN6X9Q5_9PEZI|nr:putative calcium/calmodulin-dependent protein kinase [Triangularia verruculosa]